MEVLSPGSKSVQTYVANRMLVHVYREFRANEKPDFLPHIRADELAALFPSLTDAFVRKRLKHCAVLKVRFIRTRVANCFHNTLLGGILFDLLAA